MRQPRVAGCGSEAARPARAFLEAAPFVTQRTYPSDMALPPELGRLTPVPVREVWAHEAHSFTQWLLQNVDALADELGMDLELTSAEHRVGDFALDLIGTDLQTGQAVIIENQLEPTDHRHLGQLLTYAGGTDPKTIVWCATQFRDAHRAALDWLNDNTLEDIRFFGVEVSAVRIGDSRPAPLFRLVAAPNDWAKRLHAEKAAVQPTPRAEAHEALWRLVLDRINREHPGWTSARATSRDGWITLPYGNTTATYGLVCSGDTPRVELYFGTSDAAANQREYERFVAHRQQLEARFGGSLDYQPMLGRKGCRIAALAPAPVDVLDPTQREELADWFIQTLDRFRAATQELRHAFASVGGVTRAGG